VFSFIGGFHHASLHVQKVSFIAKNIVDGLHHHWTIKRWYIAVVNINNSLLMQCCLVSPFTTYSLLYIICWYIDGM